MLPYVNRTLCCNPRRLARQLNCFTNETVKSQNFKGSGTKVIQFPQIQRLQRNLFNLNTVLERIILFYFFQFSKAKLC